MTKTALVVGASSGVGSACLRSLALAGFSVAGAARRVDRVRGLLAEFPATDPPHEALRLDVSSATDINTTLGALVKRNSAPDVLVYCAGINKYGSLHEFDKEAWDSTFAVNARGAFLVCAALTPHMKAGSRIIVVGSTAGLTPFEGGTIYCASKAALHAFTAALRRELRPRNITVCLLTPGSINTEFWQGNRPDALELLSPDVVAGLVTTAALTPDMSEVSEIVVRPICEV